MDEGLPWRQRGKLHASITAMKQAGSWICGQVAQQKFSSDVSLVSKGKRRKAEKSQLLLWCSGALTSILMQFKDRSWGSASSHLIRAERWHRASQASVTNTRRCHFLFIHEQRETLLEYFTSYFYQWRFKGKKDVNWSSWFKPPNISTCLLPQRSSPPLSHPHTAFLCLLHHLCSSWNDLMETVSSRQHAGAGEVCFRDAMWPCPAGTNGSGVRLNRWSRQSRLLWRAIRSAQRTGGTARRNLRPYLCMLHGRETYINKHNHQFFCSETVSAPQRSTEVGGVSHRYNTLCDSCLCCFLGQFLEEYWCCCNNNLTKLHSHTRSLCVTQTCWCIDVKRDAQKRRQLLNHRADAPGPYGEVHSEKILRVNDLAPNQSSGGRSLKAQATPGSSGEQPPQLGNDQVHTLRSVRLGLRSKLWWWNSGWIKTMISALSSPQCSAGLESIQLSSGNVFTSI